MIFQMPARRAESAAADIDVIRDAPFPRIGSLGRIFFQ
jgi:hypothetical protein